MIKMIELTEKAKVVSRKALILIAIIAVLFLLTATKAYGAELSVEGFLAGESSDTVKIIVLMTLIAIIPTLLLMMTDRKSVV